MTFAQSEKAMRRTHVVLQHINAADASPRILATCVAGGSFLKPGMKEDFAQDTRWAGKSIWMLHLLTIKDKKASKEYSDRFYSAFASAGVRQVFYAACRTVIGKKEFKNVVITEYPSSESFVRVITSEAFMDLENLRLAGVEDGYLIPITAGWFHLNRAAPAPSRQFQDFTVENVWATPGGLVGPTAQGSRVGETSSTREQAEAFVQDDNLKGKILWHLNLLRFNADDGKATYNKYAQAMGSKSGTLSLYGARSVLASKCWRSLVGDADFDEAIIVEYPSRDAYLSMSASQEYMKTAHFRHQGLEETYIISCDPRFVLETK